MEFCGIICEFNPFHNGHKYLIEQAKKATGKEILCIMSGNFVQRGEPAIAGKYERAKIAINNGANAVLELPTIYACSNAENFAFGAIKILSALKISHLAFGVENADLCTLEKIAALKVENSQRFQNAFHNEIQNGINFNTALKRSIAKTIDDDNIIEILNKPNNILAIEYLTAILKLKSKIKPVAINRCDNGFFSDENKGKFLSAISLRDMLKRDENIANFIPKNAKLTLICDKNHINTLNCLQILKIRDSSAKFLNSLYDYNEGIEYRIKKCADTGKNIEEIQQLIETPRYRKPRVNKLLLYPILNITKSIIEKSKHSKPVCKLLAIKKTQKNLLFEHNKNKITIIASNADYNSLTKTQKAIIDIDLASSTIFSTILGLSNNQDKTIGTLFI